MPYNSFVTTAVVIPTFNRRETLLAALKNISETLPSDHPVIVVDSGSSDGTAEAVRNEFPGVVLVHGNSSMWWAEATNVGIRQARELGCHYVLSYNDDNLATPGLFIQLGEVARRHPKSIIAAVCCYMERSDRVFFAGRMRARGSDRFYYLNHDAPRSSLGKGVREVDLLHGMCTLFPMSVFDTVGLFDAQAFPSLFADDDLVLRAKKDGYPLHVALEAIVLNDRTKTGMNPYDKPLGPIGICKLLFSRRSAFQLSRRTRFLWRHRQSLGSFLKTWLCDYVRMLSLILARWVLPANAFYSLGRRWAQRLNQP